MRSSWVADGKQRIGWLAPSGEFFPCKHGGHQDAADDLWKQYGGGQQGYRGTMDALYSRGWRSLHGNSAYVRGDFDITLTQPQINFLSDLADQIRAMDAPRSPWAQELDDAIANN